MNNLDQESFGKIINVSRSVVGSYEREKAQPSIESLIIIADYFGLTLDELIRNQLSERDLIGRQPNVSKITTVATSNSDVINELLAEKDKRIQLLEKHIAILEALPGLDFRTKAQ